MASRIDLNSPARAEGANPPAALQNVPAAQAPAVQRPACRRSQASSSIESASSCPFRLLQCISNALAAFFAWCCSWFRRSEPLVEPPAPVAANHPAGDPFRPIPAPLAINRAPEINFAQFLSRSPEWDFLKSIAHMLLKILRKLMMFAYVDARKGFGYILDGTGHGSASMGKELRESWVRF